MALRVRLHLGLRCNKVWGQCTLGKGTLGVMVQLGLGSVHLGVGCNFVGIKVCLEFQNIFGPSTFTLLNCLL